MSRPQGLTASTLHFINNLTSLTSKPCTSLISDHNDTAHAYETA
ncbi:hypothetical protein [Marinomonas rhizomae]|nr:hypothetical protein [Marinomonas rhizomae]